MLSVYLNHPLTTSTAFDSERHFFMTYSLDTTGLAPSNYVAIETHLVTPQSLANYAYVLLNHGPFFGNNLQVIYTPRNGLGVVLSLGEDYQPIFELEGFGDTTGTKVWGAISLTNPALLGSIQVSYQSLGGNWTFSNSTIFAYLNSNYFDAATQRIVLVSNGPLRLPNNPNVDWPINSRQSVAVAQAQLPVIDLIVKYEYVDNATQAQVATPGSLTNPLFVATTNQRAIQPISALTLPLPSNAAKETGGVLANMAQNLTAQRAITGTVDDVRYTGTGPSTIMSALKGIFANLEDLSVALGSSQGGSSSIEGGNTIAVKTDGSDTIQPVAIVSTAFGDYAKEAGVLLDLKNVAQESSTSIGSLWEEAYSGSGDASVIAVLKGIFEKLIGELNIRQLTGEQDTVGLKVSFMPSENTGAGVISAAAENNLILSRFTDRVFLQIQNTHATADLYLNFSESAYDAYTDVYSGLILAAGDTATYDIKVPDAALNISSKTAGATFFIIEG